MAHGTEISRFLILGCGHTGTTLVSGILHINGYGSFKISRLFENADLKLPNRGTVLVPRELELFDISGKLTNRLFQFLDDVGRRRRRRRPHHSFSFVASLTSNV